MAIAIVFLMWLIVGTINAMKGKWWMAIIFSGGLIGIITAIRVAKPDSFWDRHYSSVGDHETAVKRFTKHANKNN